MRFSTSRGQLSTEQLWDLPLNELDQLAVVLEEEANKGATKSFLITKTQENKTAKIAFDVVYEVLTSKVEEAETARTAAEIKEHNQKILGLIMEKKDESLKKMSLKQLEAQLK